MPGFLYFLPDKQGSASWADIREAGLDYAFTAGIASRGVTGGPGGKNGLIVADETRVPSGQVGFFKEKQTWRQIPQSTAYVGYYTEHPPTPDDLIRADALPGHTVTLGDGNAWMIPLARAYGIEEGTLVYYPELPRKLEMDATGNFVPGEIVKQYARLWTMATGYTDAVHRAFAATAEGATVTVEFSFDAVAADVLAFNYAVSPIEIVLLELLTFGGKLSMEILEALNDAPGREAIKKKQAGASSGERGPPGD